MLGMLGMLGVECVWVSLGITDVGEDVSASCRGVQVEGFEHASFERSCSTSSCDCKLSLFATVEDSLVIVLKVG